MTFFQTLKFAGSVLVGLSAALAQTVPTPAESVPDARQAGKKTALDAFKRGDGVSALGALKNNTDAGSSVRSTDVQVVDQLKEVASWLANERHPRAVETALLAITEAEKTRGKLNSAEESDVAATIGKLSENITGDMTKAKASYEAALRSNSKNVEATKGLARLKRLDDLIAAKSRENDALRLRKQQQPKS